MASDYLAALKVELAYCEQYGKTDRVKQIRDAIDRAEPVAPVEQVEEAVVEVPETAAPKRGRRSAKA